MTKPIIAVPMGDPAGIGPEIIVRAISSARVADAANVVVIGNSGILQKALKITESRLRIHTVQSVDCCRFDFGILNLIDIANIDFDVFSFGKVSGMCGQAAFGYIKKSIELAMNGEVDAIATTPINKESLKAGNIPFIGHTEIFASLTDSYDPLTMFETNGLRVFFLTRHLSIRQMLDQIKKDNIVSCAKRCLAALKRLGVSDGTMAIAGLNPHSGEHGLFGDEELYEIIPAVQELKNLGYDVEGPVGADSVFHQAYIGKYNSVLSLYHDQGHIATKTLDFNKTISVTNGMPILRTSVDHGTAFDIAGKGIANETSMIEAIKLAAKYSVYFLSE